MGGGKRGGSCGEDDHFLADFCDTEVVVNKKEQ